MCGNWLITEFQDVFLGIIRHRTSSSTAASASVRHSCQDQQTSNIYILHWWNFHMNLPGNSTRSKHAVIFTCFLFFSFTIANECRGGFDMAWWKEPLTLIYGFRVRVASLVLWFCYTSYCCVFFMIIFVYLDLGMVFFWIFIIFFLHDSCSKLEIGNINFTI